jgi:HD-like signal output (HDOD) protein
MNEQRPAEFNGRIADSLDWREIVAWVGDLPPMPHVASRAISMVEDPDATANKLSDLLSSDTALAARVLKIANSAMFSRQREISTLNQAIMLIGFKSLKGIVVAAALRQINRSFGELEKLVWEHSMCTALCSTLICKTLKKSYVEEIFLLGLLHSLGQIVLMSNKETSPAYQEVIDLISEKKISFTEAEQEVYGFSHPLIGALVAKKWNFSSETCQIILHYRDELEASGPGSPFDEKVGVVQLSDLITHAAGVGTPTGHPANMQDILKAARYVGFPDENLQQTLESIIAQTKQAFEKEKDIYA